MASVLSQRLDDGTSSVLEAYSKLLKSAQVHGATEQQSGDFQSSVLVAGLVQCHRHLNQSLIKRAARTTIFRPKLFPHVVRLEELAVIKQLNAGTIVRQVIGRVGHACPL